MITEDYVSFEVAKLLKEKGFDFPCTAHWFIGTDRTFNISNYPQNWNAKKTDLDWVSCPTHQMVMKWLREVYNICITIYPDKENGYEAVLYNIKDDVEIILQSFGIYGSHIFEDSYEEATEAALKYALENLI